MLSKVKQLVDLNGDSVNFEIKFRVSTKNKEPFDLLVVDQTTLDNNPALEYKKITEGEISGSIVQDKNIYQNYFLILKADTPCECMVEIQKKELPKTILPVVETRPKIVEESNKWMFIVGGVVIAGLIWYLFFNKKKGDLLPAPELPSALPTPENPFLQRFRNLNLPV